MFETRELGLQPPWGLFFNGDRRRRYNLRVLSQVRYDTESAGHFGPYVLKESWYNGEAANDESGGELGGSPQSYRDHVVAYVGGAGDLPGVVCSQDRRYASAEVGKHQYDPSPCRHCKDTRGCDHDREVWMTTYNRPAAKIIVMNIFFFSGKCNLQTQGMGRIKIAKSEKTLKTAEAFIEAS